ncbi:MAG: AAA family ATPase, partial [Pseudonocardiaceae bacterium]
MTTPASTKTGKTGLPILRPGQLLQQVAATLAGDPDRSWSVSDVARELGGRSHGAVGQALDRLTDLGRAVACGGSPRRWRAATGVAASSPAPVPSSPPGQPRAVSAPILRPNGQPYHPRLLGGRPDVQVLRELRGAEIPVLLYGPPGTGKTSLIEAAFGDELHTVAGDGDTTVGDLLGDYVPEAGGGYRFVDGPLVRAMETGGVLLIDDATLISPKVLAVMYP